jgi:hypothetical protein
MPTLEYFLLDGRVISETFNIYNPQMSGEFPVENYSYVVRGLQRGTGSLHDQILLVAEGQDGRKHYFPLVYRLEDQFIPTQTTRTASSDRVCGNRQVPNWNRLPEDVGSSSGDGACDSGEPRAGCDMI